MVTESWTTRARSFLSWRKRYLSCLAYNTESSLVFWISSMSIANNTAEFLDLPPLGSIPLLLETILWPQFKSTQASSRLDDESDFTFTYLSLSANPNG